MSGLQIMTSSRRVVKKGSKLKNKNWFKHPLGPFCFYSASNSFISKMSTKYKFRNQEQLMERAGKRISNNNDYQFWQQDNHPIELFDNEIMQQKLDYIHNNPVEAGFVENAL